MNTVNAQLLVKRIDCPKSGWSISRIIIKHKSKKLKKYLTWEFCSFSRVSIFTVINIKNGFNISIGCNLKKYKSNHRLDPFTSTPKNKTKNNVINKTKKIGVKSFVKNFV